MQDASEVKNYSTYINIDLDRVLSEVKKLSKTNNRLCLALFGCGLYAATMYARNKKQEEKIEKLNERIKELTETKGE